MTVDIICECGLLLVPPNTYRPEWTHRDGSECCHGRGRYRIPRGAILVPVDVFVISLNY